MGALPMLSMKKNLLSVNLEVRERRICMTSLFLYDGNKLDVVPNITNHHSAKKILPVSAENVPTVPEPAER